MTQEEKQLLLKDICARLPYKKLVIADVDKKGKIGRQWRLIDFNVSDRGYVTFRAESSIGISYFEPGEFKPYLRPMSSMTEEEKREVGELGVSDDGAFHNDVYDLGTSMEEAFTAISWFLERYFDINYLIQKGLALEAPEGMYQ